MAESVTGLSQLSTARSSASQSNVRNKARPSPNGREGKDTSRKRGRTPKPKRKQGGEFSELKQSLSSGKPLTIRGKGGNFKTHTGRGNAGDAGGRRGGQKGKLGANAAMKITYGDTQSTLPKFLQGRVQGATYGDETSRTTVVTGRDKGAGTPVGGKAKRRLDQQVGAGRVLPRGAAEKEMKDNTKVKQVDKKGRRYHTGNPSRDKRAAKRQSKFNSKYGKRSNKNPIVKFIAHQIRNFKRKMAMRQQNKIPVVLVTQKQLKLLRFRFMEVDFSHMGNVSYEEFFEFIDEPRSAFTDALYDQIVAKATGQMLSLDDFVIVTVLYSMYGRNDILRLVFNMFDKDGSGTIDEEEFMELCAMVNDGAPVYPGNFKNALESFDVNDDGLIDFGEFQALNKRFPLVLFPAFRLQDAIQEATLGAKEWLLINEKITEKRRLELYKAKHGGLPPPSLKTKLAHSDKIQFKIFRGCCPCLIPKASH